MTGFSLNTDSWPIGPIPAAILAILSLLAAGFAFGYGLSGLTDGSFEPLSLGAMLGGLGAGVGLLVAFGRAAKPTR